MRKIPILGELCEIKRVFYISEIICVEKIEKYLILSELSEASYKLDSFLGKLICSPPFDLSCAVFLHVLG